MLGIDCYKFCSACQKRTPHIIKQGDGCVAKICIRCEWKIQHPYAGDPNHREGLPQVPHPDSRWLSALSTLQLSYLQGVVMIRKKNRRRKLLSSSKHPGRNRHHNLAKSRGGSSEEFNMILLKVERHNLLHKIFGLRTLREIIEVLERLDRMKARQKGVLYRVA